MARTFKKGVLRMTKKEAIRLLEVEYLGDSEEIKKAKKIAINALKNCPPKDSLCYGCHDNCDNCDIMGMAML